MVSVMPTPAPVFDAELVRVVDGDTVSVRLDKFHGDQSTKTLRLLGLDTPEVYGIEKEAGLAAKAFAEAFLRNALLVPYPLVVQTVKPDKYGRMLAYVWRKIDGAGLNDALIEAGHAEAVSVTAQLAEAS